MSASVYGRYGRPIIGGLVLALALLSIISGYTQFEQRGFEAVGEIGVNFYIAGLIVWGFFREGFDTFRFRVVLYVGLVLWGTVMYFDRTESVLPVLVLIIGSLLLARAAYKYSEQQRKPVYER